MNVNSVWLYLIENILSNGSIVSPRGKKTLELRQKTLRVDMRKPLLTVPGRGLSVKGAMAEAYWICTGDDLLANIEPYLPRMKEFSDNGVTLYGAYGPRIEQQLQHVVASLLADPDTRQATLTTWRPNPPKTKDVPCTVAMDFKLRDGKLNMHVFMRSSDAWLGVPYDVFSFSMVAHLICCKLNGWRPGATPIEPGTLYLTAASSHLYEENWVAALQLRDPGPEVAYPTLEAMYTDEQRLLTRLEALHKTGPGDKLRWWETGV